MTDAKQPEPAATTPPPPRKQVEPQPPRAKEVGGPAGPEPTRYGDWERKGRCVDF